MYTGKYLSLTQEECALRVLAAFSYTEGLSPAERDRLIAEGIAIGGAHAAKVLQRHHGRKPSQIAVSNGVTVQHDEDGSRSTDFVQFATYHAKGQVIHINANAVSILRGLMDEDVGEILIAHELFHYYEMTELGRIGKRFHVMRKLFGFIPIKHSLMPVGEIAANAFCKKLSGIAFEPMALERVYFDHVNRQLELNRQLKNMK